MEEFNYILEIFKMFNIPNEEKINFRAIKDIETNQDNMQFEIESPENLSLNENENTTLDSNDRSN